MNNSSKAEARAHKLALKLRENLRKRKVQIKARQESHPADDQTLAAGEDGDGGGSEKK